MPKRSIAVLLLVSLLGCSTVRPLSDYRRYVAASQPTRLWVTPQRGGPVLLEAPRFVNDTLVGFVGGHYREFAPTDVRQVQVRQPAKGRTALLVGTVLTLGIVALASLASGGPETPIPTPEDPVTRVVPR